MSNTIQSRLLNWAGIFLFINSVILTLSPAVRERTWDVDYRLSHWVGFFIWTILFITLRYVVGKRLPESDPYLLPAAALLSGWGMLTIWRLDGSFGMRQAIWLAVSAGFFLLGLYLPANLNFLRRYKYILLTSGLLITALTLLLGTNPLGAGPRLWLGCCGVYFQPSEPLKLLLVIYLSAYLADYSHLETIHQATTNAKERKAKSWYARAWWTLNLRGKSQLLFPTLTLTGVSLLLLLVQRDLGTASIFIFLFTVILFIATGKRRILLIAGMSLLGALIVGYFFIGIIRLRVEGWLNPWEDPSGSSFQMVQSLLAIANGGMFGRGLGIGSPLLVPVSISDFIFAAVAEETGLLGALGMLALIGIILARGMSAALHATDRFRRYLSAGVVAYLGGQSLLIIGGNLRLLPLTGVTLPFVSYGGSSLLTSYIALFILLVVSNREDDEPAPLQDPQPYSLLTGILLLGLFASAVTAAWWTIFRAPDLLSRTDNARRAIADRYVPRGNLLDRNNQPINSTQGKSGEFTRVYLYPDLAPLTGYTHPVYGQAGIESSFDNYLRGYQGNPSSLIWWNHFLYGTPPPGLDVRLSISLTLQAKADALLGSHKGALVLLNAQTGEILAMASHPTYDPNQLGEQGDSLAKNKFAPLVNRAAQGLYPIENLLSSLQAEPDLLNYKALRVQDAPALNIPLDFSKSQTDLRASPLQVGLIAAALSHNGIKPAPRIALAVNTPAQGWVTLPPQSQPIQILPSATAHEIASAHIVTGKPYWRHSAQTAAKGENFTWLLSGTLPDWGGAPLALVIAVEEKNLPLVYVIADELLSAALNP